MSDLLQDIQVDLLLTDIKANNQKELLQILAKEVAPLTTCHPGDLYRWLMEKEKTSTFAIGDGLALPNLQVKYLYQSFKTLCVLKKPIDFQAPDARAVDLVCLVLSPDHEGPLHLRRLARMSRLLKSPDLRRRLLEAPDRQAMKSLIRTQQEWMQAA
jgi:nitrogen PTS system EIIA component